MGHDGCMCVQLKSIMRSMLLRALPPVTACLFRIAYDGVLAEEVRPTKATSAATSHADWHPLKEDSVLGDKGCGPGPGVCTRAHELVSWVWGGNHPDAHLFLVFMPCRSHSLCSTLACMPSPHIRIVRLGTPHQTRPMRAGVAVF